MKTFPSEGGPQEILTTREMIDVLLEEYRALYGLLLFRLNAMDRRLPIAGGGLVVLFASLSAIPDALRLAALVVLPVAFAWLLATTANHACSKEDHLRRIDEIERHVNELAGCELLVFQSQHPNLKGHIAGRTGSGAITAMATTSLVMLIACHLIFVPLRSPDLAVLAYDAYLVATAVFVAGTAVRVRRYRYRRAVADSRQERC